jgi:hypothetical protein
MAFLGDFGKYFLGGASTGDVARTVAVASGADPFTAAAIGSGAQMISEDVSRSPGRGETTQTQTVQSSQGGIGYGPAQNIEIDFAQRPDMGGFMPANYMSMTQMPQNFQNPMMQRANVIPFVPAIGGAAVGLVGEFIYDLFTGEQKKMIITRKLKRDTEDLMELFNNDMRQVALKLSELKNKQFSEENVLKILLHKFTNQGPYVTKAAVRKTRRTINKLDTLQRLYNDVCKPTARRRAPVRRRAAAKASASC